MTQEEQWIKESIENYIFAYTGKRAKIGDADAQHFTASARSYLNLCAPSLPSDLDEAAEEYAEKHQSHDIYDCYGNPESDTIGKNLAFRAGAEWMAGQGASYNTKVGWIDGPTVLDWPDDILDKFEMGDEVIVQIRKNNPAKA